MHFVRTEDLKTGMRLARPVYNKKSILLFDRNSLLSLQAIESIRNFGLIGVYVLEPAEPLPPLTQEDLEFERFQIQAVSAIEEEQDRILKTRKQNRTQSIADMVIRNYGHLDEKINFYQNLRSREDYFSRHSLNVAILCAMVTHVMNIRREEQYHTVCAAILHDMGKVKKHDDVYYGAPYTREDMLRNCETQEEAYGIIEEAFATDGSGSQFDNVTLVRSTITYTDKFQLFFVSFRYAHNHVMNQRTIQTVESMFLLRVIKHFFIVFC